MKEQFCKLINVKSIMTLLITLVFCILSIKGVINAEQFIVIFTTIVAFYFGTQAEKRRGGE
nr:MAG TPA: hypothetical protein [Caudoviricetes sp.]